MTTTGQATAGESSVTTARVSTVTTAGVAAVTAARVAGVAAGVTARVTLLSLVVLSYLQTLLDVLEFDTNDSVLRDTVYWRGGTVVGGQAVTVSVTVAG